MNIFSLLQPPSQSLSNPYDSQKTRTAEFSINNVSNFFSKKGKIIILFWSKIHKITILFYVVFSILPTYQSFWDSCYLSYLIINYFWNLFQKNVAPWSMNGPWISDKINYFQQMAQVRIFEQGLCSFQIEPIQFENVDGIEMTNGFQ